jgi:hypothetical protein
MGSKEATSSIGGGISRIPSNTQREEVITKKRHLEGPIDKILELVE